MGKRNKNGRRTRNESTNKGGAVAVVLALGALGVGAYLLSGAGGGTPITAITPEQMAAINAMLSKSGIDGLTPPTYPLRNNPVLLAKVANQLGFTEIKSLPYLYIALILMGYILSIAAAKKGMDLTNLTVDQQVELLITELKNLYAKSAYTIESSLVAELHNKPEGVITPLVTVGAMNSAEAANWLAALKNLASLNP